MTIKDLVKDTKVRFLYYRKGELWYEVLKFDKEAYEIGTGIGPLSEEECWDSIFTFPVPISDTGDGQFNAEDKGILFMRYIRKHLDAMNGDCNG